MDKGIFTLGDKDISLTMPIMKVDKQKRQVSGFATLDNEDQQKDVVLAEASQKAFKSFYGNIREMHQPIAAGRLMKFEEKEYFDPDSQKTYNGVYVTARVSDGAEDTWKKVLDGTLTGFSIHGSILKAKPNDNGGRIIEEYLMDELSLVDSPANQFAKFASIEKMDGETILKGMISETQISNVFYCQKDRAVFTSQEEQSACEFCGDTVDNIGWVEEGVSKNNQIQNILFEKGIISTNEPSVTINNTFNMDELIEKLKGLLATDNGGNSMAKDDDSTVENTETAETVEEVEDNEEVQEEPQDVSKVLDGFVEKFGQKLDEFKAENAEEINKASSEVADKLREEVKTSFDSMAERLEEVEKRLQTVEENGGVKKSLDDDDEDTLEKSNKSKSIFAGVFTPTPNI